MVEDDKKKRRTGIFGGRRARSPQPDATQQQPAGTDASAPVPPTASESESTTVSGAQPEQPRTDAAQAGETRPDTAAELDSVATEPFRAEAQSQASAEQQDEATERRAESDTLDAQAGAEEPAPSAEPQADAPQGDAGEAQTGAPQAGQADAAEEPAAEAPQRHDAHKHDAPKHDDAEASVEPGGEELDAAAAPKRSRNRRSKAKPEVNPAAVETPVEIDAEGPVESGVQAERAASDALDVPQEETEPQGQAAEQRPEPVVIRARSTTDLIFHAPPELPTLPARPERQRDERPRDEEEPAQSVRRRSRRRSGEELRDGDTDPNTVVKVRQPRQPEQITEPKAVKGSTRLEAKKQRRRDGRDAGRRRPVVTEAEFLARRESVDRKMVVRSKGGRIQIGVLEDDVLVEHYVAKSQEASLIGNVYLGRVQNVLPSMEAAFVDIGRGRNAVLYSGEVDWEAANDGENKNQPRRIELALKPGDTVLVQVTKDPVGHKGARLTSQISLPGRYLVYVPNGSMNGISRKLPDTERARLKKILKEALPDNVGVIVRTAAEGATEEQLTLDVNRLTSQWAEISRLTETQQAPALLHSEPDLLIKIIRDVFNEDFGKLLIAGDDAQSTIERYLKAVAPDLLDRVERYDGEGDPFDEYRITEQIEKALERKVWLPSGGSLVIDRTEAMTVVDVNTGKFVGSGGNLEETVTKNNLEAAEEIVRQLRLRDIGGIIVVDFIDMVLEQNRDLVLRRLVECLSRDRTKHQVAEVTSLGLVQMTRKKLGLGLLESFSEPCETCAGRGLIVHHDPVSKHRAPAGEQGNSRRNRNGGKGNGNGNGGGQQHQQQQQQQPAVKNGGTHAITEDVRKALSQIAASTVHPEHEHRTDAAEPRTPASPAEQPAPETSAEEVSVVAAEAAVAILDIPVAPAPRTQQRRISSQDAEQILGSVLDALPEPKQPGQGRGRGSRRASSTGRASDPSVTTGD
ncbi:Rne/Rng family ribonuclease [Desertivibrio insolitus]|uniref:Rne/Rng family ribonuclease n=1 Tax=Herbiconiux sp. SYSU D00978 TaxID=2812562 RepID=UPI001F6033DF|nr:Rne/Rng family ribonuclease [Herbiconiux sp. SYSU D00978]